MKSKEPRILIVNGQSMYDNNATGITLRSIVSLFNVQNIKEVYYSNEKQKNKKKDVEIESFKLDDKTMYWSIKIVMPRVLLRHLGWRYAPVVGMWPAVVVPSKRIALYSQE